MKWSASHTQDVLVTLQITCSNGNDFSKKRYWEMNKGLCSTNPNLVSDIKGGT
jgi:hypothetical protein